jgi:uncharacterized protein (TIGR03083 family)
MSEAAVAGVRALVADVLDVINELDDDEWAAPSACPGWRVQDVVAHLASFFTILVHPATAKPLTSDDVAEAVNEQAVSVRRAWTPAEVRADYARLAGPAVEALAGLQHPAVASRSVCMGDIGSYPLAALAEAACFDHLCHLVHDVLSPGGPVSRPRPPLDVTRLGPALDWMLRGLPAMSDPGIAKALDRPIGLDLTGPGGRRVGLRRAPNDPATVEVVADAGGTSTDVARSDGIDFLSWATRRTPWRDVVRLTGDRDHLARVLDLVRVI